jgi:hypothetical protein
LFVNTEKIMGQSSRAKTYALADGTPVWFPAASALTGTLTSENIKVIGTGTAFKGKIKEGDFLVNSSNIARKVAAVESDTLLFLEEAFGSDLAADTCRRVENQILRGLKVIFTTNPGAMKCASQDTEAAWPAAVVWESQIDAVYQEPLLVNPGAAGAFVIEII